MLIVSGGVLGSGAYQNLFIGAGVGGTGMVVLSAPSGSSTYTGSTGIVRGTLMMGAVTTLPAGTVLNVDTANAAEAVTFDLNNFAQTIGGIIRTNTGGGAGSRVRGIVHGNFAGSSCFSPGAGGWGRRGFSSPRSLNDFALGIFAEPMG